MTQITFTVDVPESVTLTGPDGKSEIVPLRITDWPQASLQHAVSTYFPQWISDRANSGGKDATLADRVALANKKLADILAGKIRSRGEAVEPKDPIEALAFQMAKDRFVKGSKDDKGAFVGNGLRDRAEYKGLDKAIKGDDRLQAALDLIDDKAKRERRDWVDVVKDWAVDFIPEAKRTINSRNKVGASDKFSID